MRALWLAAIVCASCSPVVDGALLALVDFGAGTTSKCLQVVVRTPEGTEVRSGPVVTDRLRPLKVGIAKSGLPDEVVVYAVGFSDAACMTPSLPVERSEDGAGVFKPGRTSMVALTLVRRPNTKDDDGDGYGSTLSGGDDCDDTDPSIHPGALEACTDGKDNDCDQAADCEETGCADKACGPIIGATCRPPKCAENLCTDDADNDGDGPRDCADSDCAGKPCRNSGTCQSSTCQGATTEKDLCSDGADNDGDQKIDCADPDCSGSLCQPGNACLTGARCDNNLTCANGVPVTCTTPPSVCAKATGSCNPADGGCTYPPDPGKPCSDGNSCTSSDSCSDAGACVGTASGCVPPAACVKATGCAPDAGCTFVPATGDVCDDGNACTAGDACQADAGCSGNAIACAANACQVFNNQCGGDGGCVFDARDAGTSCDGGVCNGAGACIPFFPYVPSNFTESVLPTPGPATTLNCDVTLDSHSVDGGVGFNGWCGNPNPPFRLIPQSSGSDAVLVAFSELEIGVDASVRLQGDRPVIFASTGNLKVLGEVAAAAGFSNCADGGAGGSPAADKGGGGGGFGSVAGQGGNTGGAAGIVNGEPRLVPLRGGCPGGGGARGGGAVQLSAAGNLTLTGTIAAPGRGGAGGQNANNGGRGAGSGGAVLLEGLFVLVGPTGAVTANGGAGGEGADLFFGGQNGAAGSTRTVDVATGGTSLNAGGRGGNGAAGTTAATGGNNAPLNAGGGGGAGVGRVRINAVTGCSLGGTSVLSPRPTSNQDAGCS